MEQLDTHKLLPGHYEYAEKRRISRLVKSRLQRAGWWATQYQGIIKTDAPREAIYRIVVAVEGNQRTPAWTRKP